MNTMELYRAAFAIREGSGLQGEEAGEAMVRFEGLATPDAILDLLRAYNRCRNALREIRIQAGEGLLDGELYD